MPIEDVDKLRRARVPAANYKNGAIQCYRRIFEKELVPGARRGEPGAWRNFLAFEFGDSRVWLKSMGFIQGRVCRPNHTKQMIKEHPYAKRGCIAALGRDSRDTLLRSPYRKR